MLFRSAENSWKFGISRNGKTIIGDNLRVRINFIDNYDIGKRFLKKVFKY